jgi:hypothetical protein
MDRIIEVFRALLAFVGLLMVAMCRTACAATPVDVIKPDLHALIRAAAPSPVQFAVHVPHAVSSATSGTWSNSNGRATWRFNARIPTAVSMSFHANPVNLPVDAVLTVRGARTTMIYRAADFKSRDFWSRIQPGEALDFTLEVPSRERSSVVFEIVSFQAGYRGLGGGVADHPYYRLLKTQTAAAGNAACVQNYECNLTASNAPPAQATVGLIVSNLYQCTGTLINDVPNDNTPYVLTARHCESGTLGGGNPGAASAVTVYWDATTPCGQTLGTLYDPGVVTQTGAITAVEQQDAWLIELNYSPVATDAQFAGFDASGGSIQGGYTIQHALGYDKQFTEWFGQAIALQQTGVLGVTYTSNFWGVVNQLGNIGPGASGSGLIDQNNHLVGSLTLGRGSDSTGYQMCPANPPSAPNGSNEVADFTSLSAVWASTADTTSSTGTATLKSVLDPGNTGTLQTASVAGADFTFTSSTYTQFLDQAAILSWSAPPGAQCTAGGGSPGDGWAGSVANAGSQSVTEGAAGLVTYVLSCSINGRTPRQWVAVRWYPPVPTANLTVSSSFRWTTRPVVLTWSANVSPCTLSGGSLSATGLPASGSTTTTQSTAGDVAYTLTCGSATSNVGVTYVTPSETLQANSTDRLLGQPLTLYWGAYGADTCTPSGGAPNDGWANNSFSVTAGPGANFTLDVTTLGSYSYTLTCSSGPVSVAKSVAVQIENNAPYVNASVNPSTVTFAPAAYVTLSWISNLTDCTWSSTPAIGQDVAITHSPYYPQDTATIAPNGPGTYVLTVTCTSPSPGTTMVTSTPLTVTVLPTPIPTASVSVSASTVPAGQELTVSWSSSNTSGCTVTESAPNVEQLWASGMALGPSGKLVITPTTPAQYTIGISCQSGINPNLIASADTPLTVTLPPVPIVTITANPTDPTVGQTVILAWSSKNASSCQAESGWTGTLGTSGTKTQTPSWAGSFTYEIECIDAGLTSSTAQVTVQVSPAAASSGGGGGGALTWWDIGLLAPAFLLRSLRPRRSV